MEIKCVIEGCQSSLKAPEATSAARYVCKNHGEFEQRHGRHRTDAEYLRELRKKEKQEKLVCISCGKSRQVNAEDKLCDPCFNKKLEMEIADYVAQNNDEDSAAGGLRNRDGSLRELGIGRER